MERPPRPFVLSYMDTALSLFEQCTAVRQFEDCKAGRVAHHLMTPDASMRVAAIPIRHRTLALLAQRYSPNVVLSRMDEVMEQEGYEGDSITERLSTIELEARAFAIGMDPRPELRARAVLLRGTPETAAHPSVEAAMVVGHQLRTLVNIQEAVVPSAPLLYAIKEASLHAARQVRHKDTD
jgi:hypothetical protein